MQDKLESKLIYDEIDEMQLVIEDSDGLLLELQREEPALQASVACTPKAPALPWTLLPK